MRRLSRWHTHWLHQSHSRWSPPPPRLGEVAVGREEHRRQRAASCPLLLQALSALKVLHQRSKPLRLLPLDLQPHSIIWDGTKWHHWGCNIWLVLGTHIHKDMSRPRHLSPCWAMLADAVGCGLELWTGTIFFITTGLPCPTSSGPVPPVAMRTADGLGATGG